MEVLPQIINREIKAQDAFPFLDEKEATYIEEAKMLFSMNMYSYALVAIWNAAVCNLRRRVEAYGVDLWQSVVKADAGRKKYDPNGDTLAERWNDVDDYVLIEGAGKLGLMDAKAAKSLEMINWMRNHASSAHDSDCMVDANDVVGLVLLIERNLFGRQLPDPGHSIGALFNPIKKQSLNEDEINSLRDQVTSLSNQDIRTMFGFLIDLIVKGEEPAFTNASELFSTVWDRSGEDLRKQLGSKYHTYVLDSDSDDSADKKAKTRLINLLVQLDAVKYIPEGTRARLFRRAAEKLAEAKNSMYGWGKEETASRNLLQLGTCVPSVAFESVYQEILAVWCGNYWGSSSASTILRPFIDCLDVDQVLNLAKLFSTNRRVREELHQKRPNLLACSLLEELKTKVTFEVHKDIINDIQKQVRALYE